MNFAVLWNFNNALGKEISRAFLEDKETALVGLTPPYLTGKDISSSAKDIPIYNYSENFMDIIRSKLQQNNIFIFNSEFIDEYQLIDENYSERLTLKLNCIFNVTKGLCKLLINENKQGKFFFITVNPGVSNILNFPTAPIYDEAIHAFLRSLAKELNPFNLVFNGICVEPILELIDKSEVRTYRNKMKIYAMKKDPIKAHELAAFIKNISLNDLSLSSGNIYCLGQGMPLPY